MVGILGVEFCEDKADSGKVESLIAAVVFVDLVAFSQLPIEQQTSLSAAFGAATQAAINKTFPDSANRPILLDTGDGIAAIFVGGSSRSIDFATTLARLLQLANVSARTGIHYGCVTRRLDINGRENVTGPGINMAQRVMDAASSGQIFLSATAVEIASAHEMWSPYLVDLGERTVKHGVKLRLSNLVLPDCGKSLPADAITFSQAPNLGPRHNFTEPERAFVGRKQELKLLSELVKSANNKLITITGIGGMGKTRLATKLAQEVYQNFRDGAWLVDCTSLNSESELMSAVAGALEMPHLSQDRKALCEAVSTKKAILIFDCFEGLIAHTGCLDYLASHAQDVQIVVTSRIVLGLARETEFALEPMAIPEDGAIGEGLTLFAEAAKTALPSFLLNEKTEADAKRIVRGVEGVPLALILAAGRLRHYSLPSLADELSMNQLGLLHRKPTADVRHASLAQVISWSYDGLPAPLQSLLQSLSVFPGSFSLNDARAVLPEHEGLEDGIFELRDKSLLSGQVLMEEMRFRILDAILEFVGQLEPVHDSIVLQRRHAAHFAQVAGQVNRQYEAGKWREAGAKLSGHLRQFRSAIAFALGQNDCDLICALADSLVHPLLEAGYRSDYEALLDAGLQIAKEKKALPLMSKLTGLKAAATRRDGKPQIATELWLQKIDFCRLHDDHNSEGDTWIDLADLSMASGNESAAEQFLANFEAILPRLDAPLVIATGLLSRARFCCRQGRLLEATTLTHQASGIISEAPHGLHSFFIWVAIADIYNRIGEPDSCLALCLKVLPEAIDGKHAAFAGLLLVHFAASLEATGKKREALLALLAANEIPKTVSRSMSEIVEAALTRFRQSHPETLCLTAQPGNGTVSWQDQTNQILTIVSERNGSVTLF